MDPRYPPVSIGVRPDALASAAPPPLSSWSVPPFDVAKYLRLSIICRRPLHHVLEFSQLFSLVEKLRRQAPHLEIHLWIRSALHDWNAIKSIQADRFGALPHDRDRAAWDSLVAHLDEEARVSLLLDADDALKDVLANARKATWLDGGSFDYEASGEESASCARATRRFHEALAREMPRWAGKDAGRPFEASMASFLVHQSRFRVGNTLWLTPLLRAIRQFYPEARITVVGSPKTACVLNHIPQVDEVLVADPTGGTAERARLLSDLRGRQFNAAILALARREKSRWLAEALADMNVPYRINLEYFDDVDIERSDLFTHEGWFFWCAIASARFLLHGLCPLVGQQRTASESWLQDRCVKFPVRPTWRQEAKRVLAERGIGNHPFVLLTPGGSSSQRWPTRKFAALAVRLAEEFGVHVIVEGGPADGELVERTMQHVAELQRSTRGVTRCVAAHDSLGVLAALLERSSLLVSNDSAPIHLAESTGTPTLYFSHHEKLTHSHPSRHSQWALYDLLQNRVANIPVDSALSAVSQMIERRHVALSRHPELGAGLAS